MFCILPLLASAASASAPQVPPVKATLVVTAAREEQPRDQAAAAVTLLTREDVARLPAASLAEVLAFVPGVTMMFQTGVSPDRTADGAIMFGYAFAPVAAAMQPQSFYFSGYPLPPADAPIVSQNYTDFTVTRPDPAKTWDQVKDIDPNTIPQCQLFNPPSSAALAAAPKGAPTWGDIGRWRR